MIFSEPRLFASKVARRAPPAVPRVVSLAPTETPRPRLRVPSPPDNGARAGGSPAPRLARGDEINSVRRFEEVVLSRAGAMGFRCGDWATN